MTKSYEAKKLKVVKAKKPGKARTKVIDKQVTCPMGKGATLMVSVKDVCQKKCPQFIKVMEKNSKEAIPAKVYCWLPVDFYQVIHDKVDIEFPKG